jgi:hypothetical protein
MAKIETAYLRRFLDPVNEASAEHRNAIKALDGVTQLSSSRRNKVIRECAKAEEAYTSAVGELIGGLNKLVLDAETEDAPPG